MSKMFYQIEESFLRRVDKDSFFHFNPNQISESKLSETSFGFIAEEWFKFKNPKLKFSSSAKYLNILQQHLLPQFSDREITTIKRKELVEFSQILSQTGNNHYGCLSASTVNNILSVAKSIFAFAKAEKGLTVCDLKGIRIKETFKPLKILSSKDQQKLTTALLADPTGKNLGIIMALYTGIRIGELCALRWEDISLSNQTIYIHCTLQRVQTKSIEGKKTTIVMMPPKRPSSIRYVPIPAALCNLLRTQQKNPSYFILSGQEHAIEPRTLEYHFKRILEKWQIQKINFHALRHTFATRCVELGFDIKSLSEILGHANVNITLNRYVHPSMALKQKNMNKLSAFISQD